MNSLNISLPLSSSSLLSLPTHSIFSPSIPLSFLTYLTIFPISSFSLEKLINTNQKTTQETKQKHKMGTRGNSRLTSAIASDNKNGLTPS